MNIEVNQEILDSIKTSALESLNLLMHCVNTESAEHQRLSKHISNIIKLTENFNNINPDLNINYQMTGYEMTFEAFTQLSYKGRTLLFVRDFSLSIEYKHKSWFASRYVLNNFLAVAPTFPLLLEEIAREFFFLLDITKDPKLLGSDDTRKEREIILNHIKDTSEVK